MRMIDKIMRSMRDTGLLDGMSDEDTDTLATAAIEAMREPNLSMRQAGAFRMRLIELGNGKTVEGMALGDHPITSYTKMIEAALNE